ncbi:MAG: hypothetical protein ACJAS9_000907 [Polaribacter sp.]|jgi:uncharacterized protein YPO0396
MQDDQGEYQYKSLIVIIDQLKVAIEKKRTRLAQALLDQRYRLQFAVAIIDRKAKQKSKHEQVQRGYWG